MRKIREVYAELDRLNRQALDPAAHQNPTRMNQLNQEMKRLRASVGEQTLGDRVESGLGAIAASSAGGVANAAGLASGTRRSPETGRSRHGRSWRPGG